MRKGIVLHRGVLALSHKKNPRILLAKTQDSYTKTSSPAAQYLFSRERTTSMFTVIFIYAIIEE